MAVVTMRQLLESGVHFGHQTRRWNPKMKRFIMTERNGIYIIDLQQSVTYINNAYEFVRETVAHGGTILFVGTKRQAQEPVAEQATRVGMPYVNHRWLGGMLTNFQKRCAPVTLRLIFARLLSSRPLVSLATRLSGCSGVATGSVSSSQSRSLRRAGEERVEGRMQSNLHLL
jgi:hypothetical protein